MLEQEEQYALKPNRKTEFDKLEENKSPLKMGNFSASNNYGRGAIIISDKNNLL